jgi:hypothetical protein
MVSGRCAPRLRAFVWANRPNATSLVLLRIAAKARCEPKLRFTSLAHHITRERVWTNLQQIPKDSAPGVDGQHVTEAKESFGAWIEPMLQSVHRQGYRAPAIRRVYIPKPGKQEKRPLGVPCVNDRALQRSAAQAMFPFTLVPAYGLPVYASQCPLPDTTQDLVRGCWLGFAAVTISDDWLPCACKAQLPHHLAYGSRTSAVRRIEPSP